LTPKAREFVNHQNRASTPVTSASIAAHVQGDDGDNSKQNNEAFSQANVFFPFTKKKNEIFWQKKQDRCLCVQTT